MCPAETNAATAGAFTAEWLLKSGWNREQAAAANRRQRLGLAFPCAGLFIVLGFPTVAGIVEEGALYIALLVTGLYQVAWRLVYIHYVVRKNHISPLWWVSRSPSRKYSASMASV